MASLFDGTKNMEDTQKIYDRLEANRPPSSYKSKSKALWDLRPPEIKICDHNTSKETMLEKAVAMLADKGYMPKWCNQCPAASGIVTPYSDRKSSVDLVHWDALNKRARLVELKWASNDPVYALKEVLRYGVAYIFCRIHRNDLPLRGRPVMDARHVSLEVAAPAHYYPGHDFAGSLARMRASIDAFIASAGIDGLTMSLDALAFPDDFYQLPFADGEEVTRKCDTRQLTLEGRSVRDAFAGLTPVE